MIEELFTDTERRLLVDLTMKAILAINPQNGQYDLAIKELNGVLSKLTGTDTVLTVHRSYKSHQLRTSDEATMERTRALYRDSRFEPRRCDNYACRKQYNGPSVYCSLECALGDA
jgi:hypothetical protein